MERYHTFPGAGDGDTVPALSVSGGIVYGWAAIGGVDPATLMVMRKDEDGSWVKFTDALARSRKEYDEGYKAAKAGGVQKLSYQVGLAQGRQEGQTKVDAIAEISSAQLAQEFDRAHKAAFSSKLVELIDSHKADLTYTNELEEAQEAVNEIIALLRSYQDVQVTGKRGVELATKLTAFIEKHGT